MHQMLVLVLFFPAPFNPDHISYPGRVFITIRIQKQTCFELSDMKHWPLQLDGAGTQLVSISSFHLYLSNVREHNRWKSMKINMPT